MRRLTDADVKSLKAPEHGRLEVRDSDVRGLAIRVFLFLGAKSKSKFKHSWFKIEDKAHGNFSRRGESLVRLR
jgi:hypothetical protein